MTPRQSSIRVPLLALAALASLLAYANTAGAQGLLDPRNAEPTADLTLFHFQEVADYGWMLWRRQNVVSMGSGSYANRRHWDLWGHGAWEQENVHRNDGAFEYAGETWGAALGADRSVGPLFLGVSAGYFDRKTDFDLPETRIDTNYFNCGIYGSWDPEPLGVDFAVTYTEATDDIMRAVTGVGDGWARGEVDSHYFSTYVMGRWDVPLMVFTFTPTVGFRYTRGETPSWEERDAGTYDLIFDGMDRESMVGDLGCVVVSEILPVWKVQLYGFWEHEFREDQIELTARYRGPDARFTVQSLKLGRDAGRFGVMIFRRLNRRFDLYVHYDGLFRDGHDNHQFSVGGVMGY